MSGRNKTPLLGWHPADPSLKPWVEAEALRREVTVSAILNEALAQYRDQAAVQGAVARDGEDRVRP